VDSFKNSPLDEAIKQGIELKTIIKLLRTDTLNSTTSEKAAEAGHWELFAYLWEKDARPNKQFTISEPIIICPQKKECWKKIKQLLDQSKNCNN
jgi:hypothetical protein